MSARQLFFGLFIGLALGGYAAAYLAYSAQKLERLKPRALTPRPQWAGAADARNRLLLVGDSRIAYWPLKPPPGWRAGKIGFSGEAAVNIEPAARGIIAASRPDAVAVQAGGNDATAAVFQFGAARARTLARAAEATLAIAEAARAAGAARVILLTVVPPIAPELWSRALMGSTQAELFRSVSEEIRRGAVARGFEVLDADALFRDPDGALRLDYRQDTLHWSQAAYDALDAALYETLERPAPGSGGR